MEPNESRFVLERKARLQLQRLIADGNTPQKIVKRARIVLMTADEALYDLANTPCADDAEFIEKLRYLYVHQARMWGPQNNANDYGCLAMAVACHLGPANA
jgi:hypothetical protein